MDMNFQESIKSGLSKLNFKSLKEGQTLVCLLEIRIICFELLP